MKTRHILIAAALTALCITSAGAYTYTVWKDEIISSYTTIIPTDSPLRNSVPQGTCNGGFSPNPCVGAVPEPGTFALFGAGLIILIGRMTWN